MVADGRDRPLAVGGGAFAEGPRGGRRPRSASRRSGTGRRQPAARALLSALAATARGLDGEQAAEVVDRPIGRMIRCRCQLRRVAVAPRTPTCPGDDVRAGSHRPHAAAAADARRTRQAGSVWPPPPEAGHRDPRYTLWQAWNRDNCSGAGSPLQSGGAEGALNAISRPSLRAVRHRRRLRRPYRRASPIGLLDHVAAPTLPSRRRRTLPAGETVAVLSPHAALHRDWDMVVIAGLQEACGPTPLHLRRRAGHQRLLDVLDGLGDDVSRVRGCSPRSVGCSSRYGAYPAAAARQTAVDSDSGDEVVCRRRSSPSSRRTPVTPMRRLPMAPHPPVLSPATVVGRLRRGGVRRTAPSMRTSVPARQTSWRASPSPVYPAILHSGVA